MAETTKFDMKFPLIIDTLFQQVLRFRRLKDANSKDSLDHFHFCLRMEHVGPIQIKSFFALEKVPSLNVKGKHW